MACYGFMFPLTFLHLFCQPQLSRLLPTYRTKLHRKLPNVQACWLINFSQLWSMYAKRMTTSTFVCRHQRLYPVSGCMTCVLLARLYCFGMALKEVDKMLQQVMSAVLMGSDYFSSLFFTKAVSDIHRSWCQAPSQNLLARCPTR